MGKFELWFKTTFFVLLFCFLSCASIRKNEQLEKKKLQEIDNYYISTVIKEASKLIHCSQQNLSYKIIKTVQFRSPLTWTSIYHNSSKHVSIEGCNIKIVMDIVCYDLADYEKQTCKIMVEGDESRKLTLKYKKMKKKELQIKQEEEFNAEQEARRQRGRD